MNQYIITQEQVEEIQSALVGATINIHKSFYEKAQMDIQEVSSIVESFVPYAGEVLNPNDIKFISRLTNYSTGEQQKFVNLTGPSSHSIDFRAAHFRDMLDKHNYSMRLAFSDVDPTEDWWLGESDEQQKETRSDFVRKYRAENILPHLENNNSK